MTLTFEPLLPPVAWVSLAVLAIVMWVWYASGRPKACGRKLWALIMALTVAAIAAVLTVLLNPIWLETMPPPAGKPSLTILVDDSISMNTIDDGSKETRFVRATAAVQKLVKDVESTFDVSIRTYAKESQSTTVEQLSTVQPSSNVTNIATPLVEALAADRPQGQAVLLVSDGIHNATGNADRVIEAAEVAKSRDAPVYTATV